jgi:hypothetical protein
MSQPTQSSLEWLQIVRSEYLELPGLHLTRAQMQRLWGFDELTCDDTLNALVSVSFLKKTARGGYILAEADR